MAKYNFTCKLHTRLGRAKKYIFQPGPEYIYKHTTESSTCARRFPRDISFNLGAFITKLVVNVIVTEHRQPKSKSKSKSH